MSSMNDIVTNGMETDLNIKSNTETTAGVGQQHQQQQQQVDLYDNISYEDALDDVHTRFILNLPESELRTSDRIFVQIEQAWWYYEDFICDPRPHLSYLPRFGHLRPFAKELFDYSTVLPDSSQFNTMWKEYSIYKKKISNYGCILLSADYQRMVLCQVYNGKSYTLPSGKINEGEDGSAAASRETYEETGFDPSCKYGLTAEWKDNTPNKITWNTNFLKKDKLIHQEDDNNGKRRTCYVIAGVPEDFPFAPVCRKEVSNIEWHSIDQLPTATFAVLPFMKPLRKWISKQTMNSTIPTIPATTTTKRESSNPKSRKSRERNKISTPQRNNNNNNNSRNRNRKNTDEDNTTTSQYELNNNNNNNNTNKGWSEEEMFQVNALLLGRTVEYDGNPHKFVDEGLSIIDPHSYRIVGGTLLNSTNNKINNDNNTNNDDHNNATMTIGTTGGIASLYPTSDHSRLESLFNEKKQNTIHNNHNQKLNHHTSSRDELTPFFTSDGATPWGEIVPNLQQNSNPLSFQKQPSRNKKSTPKQIRNKSSSVETFTPEMFHIASDIIPTDNEITMKNKLARNNVPVSQPSIPIILSRQPKQPKQQRQQQQQSNQKLLQRQIQYEENLKFIQNWVSNLPKPQVTKHFGLFTLDANMIIEQAMKDIALQK